MPLSMDDDRLEWVPTNELRWRKPCSDAQPRILEQKWMSEAGTVEWRELPLVSQRELDTVTAT